MMLIEEFEAVEESYMCTRCLIVKPTAEFRKGGKGGETPRIRCKACASQIYAERRAKMTVEELAAKRERERLSKLTPRARELGRASKKRQYSDPLFRKKRKDYVAAWSQTPGTQARLKETKKAYHQRPEVKARIRAYTSERRSSDPAYKALHAARVRLRGVLKLAGETKSVKTLELLGCTASELKEHIESQFSPGMNWSNHGSTGWHIDHIKPCASFDLSDPAQQRACFHFSNLQPLWWLENLKKGAS